MAQAEMNGSTDLRPYLVFLANEYIRVYALCGPKIVGPNSAVDLFLDSNITPVVNESDPTRRASAVLAAALPPGLASC